MACESPSSSTWGTHFFDGAAPPNTNDLFWSSSKSLADNSTDFSHLHDYLVDEDRHAVPSSAASTQSDSDCFPASSVHHMLSWSTAGDRNSSSPVKRASELNGLGGAVTSPGDAISPSGLSDRNSDSNGLLEDTWFIPSPESGAVPAINQGLLQRKKRMHFVKHLPSGLQGEDGGGGESMTLKGAKSVPNFNNRRISSAGYTARLEDLLSEMGWPSLQAREDGSSTAAEEERDSDVGNDTIHAGNSFSANPQSAGGMSNSTYSFSNNDKSNNTTQAATYPYAQHSGSGNVDALASSQSSLSSTNSALYKRRAGSRDGNMPVPGPVAVPARMDASPSHSSASLLSSLSGPASAQQRAAALMAQQQRLQYMAEMVNAPSSSGQSNSGGSGQDSVKSTFSLLSDTQSSPPSSRPSVRNPTAALNGGQQQNAMEPSTSGGARPDTASSGGETPITPFVGMTLNGTTDMASMAQWNGAQSYIFPASGHTASVDYGLMASLNKANGAAHAAFGLQHPIVSKDALQADQYLATLQNSLGLYNVPQSGSPAAINPAAMMDPSAFSSTFGAMTHSTSSNDGFASMHNVMQSPRSAVMQLPNTHPMQHQRLLFPPNLQKVGRVGMSVLGQRPRAGTAMASLGGGHPSPRHMRSTPNLHLSPSPSLDGSQHARSGSNGTSSATTTPVKTLRKIASNRRLTMLNPTTPDMPSPVHSLGGGTMPASPVSPTKRGRHVGGGALSSSVSMGNLSAAASNAGGGGGFEFVNYGIEDADELCSAVAPSGSYKVPLKGFGDDGDDDEGGYGSGMGAGDDYDDDDAAGSGNTDSELTMSPQRPRRARSSTNRSGPRWADPNAPPLPSEAVDIGIGARQIKRQKSDLGLMMAGRKKSPSMSNLRRRD